MELVVWVDNARGVGIDNLEILAVDDAHDAVARCLRLAGDDAELLADKGIHQRGLSYVGVTDDINKS